MPRQARQGEANTVPFCVHPSVFCFGSRTRADKGPLWPLLSGGWDPSKNTRSATRHCYCCRRPAISGLFGLTTSTPMLYIFAAVRAKRLLDLATLITIPTTNARRIDANRYHTLACDAVREEWSLKLRYCCSAPSGMLFYRFLASIHPKHKLEDISQNAT